jgi:hypothetical protein
VDFGGPEAADDHEKLLVTCETAHPYRTLRIPPRANLLA